MPVTTKPTPEVAEQSQLDAYLRSRATVTVEELNEPFRDADLFELPTFDGQWLEIQLPKGKSYKRLRNIEDENQHLKYVWLDEKTSKLHPRFRHGFYLVNRGNEGAKGIPDKYFGAAGIIARGEHYLWFCTRTHWEQMRKAEDEPLYGQLVDYHSDDASNTQWGKGGAADQSRTQKTTVQHGIIDDEDDE